MSIVDAASVPPAERMGPANDIERYSDPSEFFFILISLIPCRGAIVTPSVTIANPTLTARSSLSWRVVSEPKYYCADAVLTTPILAAPFSVILENLNEFSYLSRDFRNIVGAPLRFLYC